MRRLNGKLAPTDWGAPSRHSIRINGPGRVRLPGTCHGNGGYHGSNRRTLQALVNEWSGVRIRGGGSIEGAATPFSSENADASESGSQVSCLQDNHKAEFYTKGYPVTRNVWMDHNMANPIYSHLRS